MGGDDHQSQATSWGSLPGGACTPSVCSSGGSAPAVTHGGRSIWGTEANARHEPSACS